MPRDGSGIYTYPPGSPGIPDTTIESAKYNGYIADIQQDLNLPRPIVAGGTGATSADSALANLNGEKAAQLVTNYDSHLWIPGSFRSAVGATGAPNGTDAFCGIVYINEALASPPTNQNVTLEARSMISGVLYVRGKLAGVWYPWHVEVVDMTGENVNVIGTNPTISMTKATETDVCQMAVNTGINGRWLWRFSDPGSNFALYPVNDAGVNQPSALSINRGTGATTVKALTAAAVTATTVVSSGTITTNNGRLISAIPAAGQPSVVFGNATTVRGMWLNTADFAMGSATADGTPATYWVNFNAAAFLVTGTTAYKPGGGSWTDSSDARIKNVLGNYDNGLDAILQLQPVRYTFKGNDTAEAPQHAVILDENAQRLPVSKDAPSAPYGNSPHYQAATDGKEFVGLIAQATEAAMPEMVKQRAAMIDGQTVTDMRDLDTTSLIFALVNACKELASRVEALEAAQAAP